MLSPKAINHLTELTYEIALDPTRERRQKELAPKRRREKPAAELKCCAPLGGLPQLADRPALAGSP